MTERTIRETNQGSNVFQETRFENPYCPYILFLWQSGIGKRFSRGLEYWY